MTDQMIPVWDVGDRMAKAMRHAGLGTAEIADYLGVSRQTVARWIHGRTVPSKMTLRVWSMRTGVPLEWLETGQYAIRDSNPEPAVLRRAA